jgi:hypothetical protein
MPDYINYSIDELKNVEQHIGKDLYRERYERIKKELANKRVQVRISAPIKQAQDDVEDEEVKPPPSKKKKNSWHLSSSVFVIFSL